MCGIVAYIGQRQSAPIIQAGLHRLEYRGYDSAGIAVLNGTGIRCIKSSGKLDNLNELLAAKPLAGTVGIGHTRWATHGPPTEQNAHPHLDATGSFAVVHNGIIENFEEIRESLRSDGAQFASDTDTEVLAHLIGRHFNGNLFDAVKAALGEVRGSYGIVVMSKDAPGTIVAARLGSPLVIGLGKDEMFACSDVSALLDHTRRVIYLSDRQIACITATGCEIESLDGTPVSPEIHEIDWDPEAVEKGEYPHFMLKEVYEQPDVLRRIVGTYVDKANGSCCFPGLGLSDEQIRRMQRISIVACGTAYHAGITAKYWLERIAGIHTSVEIASEFRYREPVLDPDTLVIAISQSGETSDTLEALRTARAHGCPGIAVLNVQGSTMSREVDGAAYILAGPEIGVASTKAYTAQLLTLLLLTIHFGNARKSIETDRARKLLDEIAQLPALAERTLARAADIEAVANDPKYRDAASALFLGRGYNLPTAMEGALKLKEISYIHAEGCGAGEMKHGWIALVTDVFPCICVVPQGSVYDKMISNMEEIRARNGIVLAVANEADDSIFNHADDVLKIPESPEFLSPFTSTIVLQLLAYHVAAARGCDVDQPRNLAKSVTVE